MMTPEEMRVAIAEKCGWKRSKVRSDRWLAPGETMDPPVVWHALPTDYPSDLNAMREAALQTFTDSIGQLRFSRELHEVVGRGTPNFPGYNIWDAENATARQRAEAFCRVFWPERFQ